jgi:hypothetical protein
VIDEIGSLSSNPAPFKIVYTKEADSSGGFPGRRKTITLNINRK